MATSKLILSRQERKNSPLESLCVLPLFQNSQNTPALKPLLPEGGFLKLILDIAREVVAERFGEKKMGAQ